MIFVKNEVAVSVALRANDIAEELGAKQGFKSIGDEKNDVCVFVKWVDVDLIKLAKSRGNTTVYDPVDLYCNKGISTLFAPYVDIVLVPNQQCIRYYSSIFTQAAFKIVPHQWDKRLSSASPQDKVRTGYIGEDLNLGYREFTGKRFTEHREMLLGAEACNLHLSLNARIGAHALLKPATKVSTASAVGANVIAYQDPSALEILPRQYPYYVTNHDDPGEVIKYAEKSFGGEVWRRGLEMMAEVKERTSIQSIAKLYSFENLIQRAA